MSNGRTNKASTKVMVVTDIARRAEKNIMGRKKKTMWSDWED